MENNAQWQRWQLRTRSQGEIMRLICTHRDISRIEISHLLGMPKMTVSNVVSGLIDMGLVVEGDPLSTRSIGRSPITLRVAPGAPLIIGVCIMREACTVMLSDLQLNQLRASRVLMPPRDLTLEELLVNMVDSLEVDMDRVLAIGVSSLGPADIDRGFILSPTSFYGIENVAVGELLSKQYGKAVFFNNDVNCSALVERLFGRGAGFDYFLELSLSNGIGSGIMDRGHLYQDESGMAGEFGHISIDYGGPLCACGNRGCLECYASIPVLEEQLRKVTGARGSFKDYCALESGEVDRVLRAMLDKLACALIGQVNMLNPQCVIVCNEGSWLKDRHLAYLETRINEGKLSKNLGSVRVIRSAFGDRSAQFGGIGVVLDKLFSV